MSQAAASFLEAQSNRRRFVAVNFASDLPSQTRQQIRLLVLYVAGHKASQLGGLSSAERQPLIDAYIRKPYETTANAGCSSYPRKCLCLRQRAQVVTSSRAPRAGQSSRAANSQSR